MRAAKPALHCLRCKTAELVVLPESTEETTFYECPRCRRHFALKSGRGLCERWGGALSLVLYGVIFERQPQTAARRVAELFLAQRSGEEVARMKAEIAQELAEPTQNVCDILGLEQREADVRAFLRSVVDHWEEALKGRPTAGEVHD